MTRLHRDAVWVLNQPDVKERFFKMGVETVGSTPQQFAATIKAETARLVKVLSGAGVRGER